MKRRLCTLILAGATVLGTVDGLRAGESRPEQETPVTAPDLSSEDRRVIRNMELLALMELLKDMDLLTGENQALAEDEQ